jgi:hypothetical protein
MPAKGRKQREIANDQIDRTKPAYLVIQEKCGGLSQFCKDYDYSPSTVYGWLVSGQIPSRPRQTPAGQMTHPAWILHRAKELGNRQLSAADFIEQPSAPPAAVAS